MKRYAVLLLSVAVLLCACTNLKGAMESVIQTEANSETVMPAPETMPAVFETTEPTAPPHSPLYYPDYAPEQIREYFAEVVLDIEYTDGEGNPSLVQKWAEPISYRISGAPTEEDLGVLQNFFDQLNQIPGFPGIYEAAEEDTEHLRLSFLDPETFRMSFPDVIGGEDATGAVQFWYYIETNGIYSARIGCRTDIDQSVRNSVLIEEIVNALGISDTLLREDSISYQYSDENLTLSDVDWILLKLLYHPDILCGMDAGECAAAIQQLYY